MSFESVYESHLPSLFRYVHRWTGDVDAAADVTQETFVRYLRSTVPEDEARPWLFRVATNLMRDRRRRRQRRTRLVREWKALQEEAVDPRESERSLEVSRVRRALGRLAERDRQMLLMREEGFSYAEIARAVGVAPSSVGTLLVRSLRRFKEAYEAG